MGCQLPQPTSRPTDPDRLEVAADQAIAACGGDAREAVKALIVANEFLERRLEELASPGYARGRVLPRDRKDWYD
nr:hypothetical protein [Bradyrhizobium yuanmingense]